MKIHYFILAALVALSSCSREVTIDRHIDKTADIFPDYVDVTIPCNIAPMNFQLNGAENIETQLIIKGENMSFQVEGEDGDFEIPEKKWRTLLEANKDKDIEFTVCRQEFNGEWVALTPFVMHVKSDKIDPWLAYRLIPPGYGIWNAMGIYQRCLENFTEKEILTNRETQYNCMNCHAFQNGNPNKMVLHLRGRHGASIQVEGKSAKKIEPKMPDGLKGVGYNQWHPTHNLVAMASYKTAQSFYANHRNRIEVYDTRTDVVVYNSDKEEAYTAPYLADPAKFQTMPSFSADGKTIYWSVADTVPNPIPVHYDKAFFSLLKADFDPETCTFAQKPDTVLNAETDSCSYMYARESPDGRWLVYNKYDYGYFPINHKEGDLWIRNNETKEVRRMDKACSDDTESYHTWSRNSHWLVFSSRRLDGLFIGAFFTYIDDNGKDHKAFLMPQKHPRKFYDNQFNSYNIPEFITGEVKTDQRMIQELVW